MINQKHHKKNVSPLNMHTGLNTTKTTASDYSDWTVTMNWNEGSHDIDATSRIGMPFLYFSKGSSDVVEITINSGTATISNEVLIIENASNTKDFVFYAPAGSTWSQNGAIFTSSLNIFFSSKLYRII